MNNLRILSNFLALLLFTTTVNAASHCVILQYHHFSSSTPAITSVSPEQFEAQLEYLENNKFQVMPLKEVVLKLRTNQPLPDYCVALTVDDAWSSVYETAYPKLKSRGWPMTVFVNSQSVDKKLRTTLTWEQIREMAEHGFSFENHGHTHDHLIRLKPGETANQWKHRITKNIITANKRITEETGTQPEFFAYPYGEYTPELKQLVTELGFTGFGQQSGPAWNKADFSTLPRFPIAGNYAKLAGFITKINTLPLAVESATPDNPLVPSDVWRPKLTLHLDIKKNRTAQLNCFVNGSSRVSLNWIDTKTVEIQPDFNLTAGRNRTNCTLPSDIKGRYHWYSHNWIKKQADGSWYQEY